jgi:hypothetical protein
MKRKGAVMLATYRAVLNGNRLEWHGEEPEKLPLGRGVEVFVTILESSDSPLAKSRGAAMAAALERLAAAGGPKSFGDAAEWERDTRGERTLPGRES